MTKRKVKAVGLLSGGLDSILAVKVLQMQDVEIIGVTFVTPFFGPQAGLSAGRKAGVEIRAVDISEAHLEMVKNPRYGYGSQMNPCIDCHGLMLKEAGKIMEEEGADFLFTGEVLGQRPMSQRRDSLRSVEKLSGYPGRVLRPLSAKLLPPTLVERQGLIDRTRLLDIQGRGRKRQMDLAARFGIRDYPQPGGGCMLTKEGFSDRLRTFLERYPDASPSDVEFLKWGRSYWLPGGRLCVIGRNKSDNQRLSSMVRDHDVLLEIPDYPAPKGVIIGCAGETKGVRLAALILVSYCNAPPGARVRVTWTHNRQTDSFVVNKTDRDRFRKFLR